MWIKKEYDYNDLKENSWSGAVNTLRRIEEANKEEELMNFLEDIFYKNIPSDTDVNDLLWFDSELIYESLGITDEDEDEVIEDEEVTPEDLDKFAR
ncbi:MAG TPA: hypothetical protein PK507_02580 [bacterium]|nr:hypothetical protein [bacterium]